MPTSCKSISRASKQVCRLLTICSSAINGTNVYVIYAQTADFSIDDVPCSDPTPSSSALGTVTVTQTLSCGFSKDDVFLRSPEPTETNLPAVDLTTATTSKTPAKTTTASSYPTSSLNGTVVVVSATSKPTAVVVSSASVLGGAAWLPALVGGLACAVALYA